MCSVRTAYYQDMSHIIVLSASWAQQYNLERSSSQSSLNILVYGLIFLVLDFLFKVDAQFHVIVVPFIFAGTN
jgi:hypothetical protein